MKSKQLKLTRNMRFRTDKQKNPSDETPQSDIIKPKKEALKPKWVTSNNAG